MMRVDFATWAGMLHEACWLEKHGSWDWVCVHEMAARHLDWTLE